MSKTYYSVLTTYGSQLFASAMANRQAVNIRQMAVGDGNGRAVTPDSARTTLVREVHRANISAVSPDPRNNKQVIFELTIPENVGGFWIREIGIYDAQNRLVAYANCPETFKPRLEEGSGKIQVIRMVLLVSSSNAVTLTVDDSVIWATRGQLTPKTITANSKNSVDSTGHTHAIDSASTTQKGIVQLNNTLTSTSQEQALTAAQGKVLKDLVDKWQITETTANANTLTTDGIYAYTTTVEGKNLPSNHNYHLFVMGGGNANWCRQIAKKAYGLETYERTKTSYNGEWSAWKRTDTLGLFSYIQNVNLNDYKQGGFYFVGYGENRPVAHSGILQVFAVQLSGVVNGVQQIYTLFNKTETYQRWFDNSNNTWGEWKRIDGSDWADVRNRPRTLDGYATTMNGQFTLNHLAAFVKGQRNSVDSWFVGLINNESNDVAIYSYIHEAGIKLKSDRVESNKPLYVNNSPVFTEATLTPARDTNLTAFIPGTQIKYQDATPAQLPVGTHMGFSQNAQLKDSGVYSGWGMVSKPQNSVNSAVRFGINAGRFYFQQGSWDSPNAWGSAVELAPKATTLAGYGITDAIAIKGSQNSNLNQLANQNAVWWVSGANKSELGFSNDMYNYGTGLTFSSGASSSMFYIPHTTTKPKLYIKSAFNGYQPSPWAEVAMLDDVKNALPLGSVIAFPKEITHPVGFLKCDGTTFNQQTYPDLYRTLGNKNTLPNLQRSDVGQLAYFPSDTIPDGWLACDGQVISQTVYPELYAYLGSKYGANGKLPNAEDRFIRNAGNGLRVGEKQSDEIKAHTHKLISYDRNRSDNEAIYGRGFGSEAQTNTAIVDTWGDNTLNDNGWITPTTASKYATGGTETRPKSIIFKLCIKAKNSFDDVQFWIKAFGEVQNAGAMDASRLGQDIQALRAEKADRNHTHTVSQITDFAQGVAEQFSYQKVGDFEIRKYPDGTMIQTCLHRKGGLEYNKHSNENSDVFTLVYPLTFTETPVVSITPQLSHPYFDDANGTIATNDKRKRLVSPIWESNDGLVGLTIDNNKSQCQFNYANGNVFISEMTFHIFAIGRWK
ncbi:phage tail-collar fiber domain-containing protein [Ursidibacter arcticus]